MKQATTKRPTTQADWIAGASNASAIPLSVASGGRIFTVYISKPEALRLVREGPQAWTVLTGSAIAMAARGIYSQNPLA